MILVVLIKLNNVADLATKRRSSKAPEHEHQRSANGALAQMKSIRAIQSHQARVRRIIAGL